MESNLADEVLTLNGFHSIKPEDNRLFFSEVYRILKPDGIFFGVFHSKEGMIASSEKTVRDFMEAYHCSEAEARIVINERNQHWGIDLEKGIYTCQAKPPFGMQAYSKKDLEELAYKAGFVGIELEKVMLEESFRKLYKLDAEDFDWILKAKKEKNEFI